LATIAAAHVAAATRNFLTLEYHFIETPWIGAYVRRVDGLPLFKNGGIPLSTAPGLGVELDPAVCDAQFHEGERIYEH
jgi:L-alanine-DL-glutamate epimerase-like enolase superfamily enzyme